jgi:hypothetical protein
MSTETPTAIENFDIVTTNTATSFKVEITRLNLFISVELRVILLDANNNLIRVSYLTLSGDDYNNWANNDEYIITYVAKYFGFTLKPNTSTVVSADVVTADVVTADVVTDSVVTDSVVTDSVVTADVVTDSVVDNLVVDE